MSISVGKTIFKNSTWLISGEVISKLLAFLFTIIVARSFGVENFGKYGFSMSFILLFSVLTDLGLNIFMFREISRDRKTLVRYVGNILMLRIVLCCIAGALVILMAQYLGFSGDRKLLIYLLTGWTIFINLSQVFRIGFKAMEEMQYEAFIEVFDNLLRVVFIFGLIWLGCGILGAGISLLIAASFTLCLSIFLFVRRFSGIIFRVDFRLWGSALRQVIPLSLATILITYFGKIDNIIISHYSGDSSVGFYDAALRLVWMLIFVPGFVSHACFPKLSEYSVNSVEKFNKLLATLLKVNLLMTLPISLVIFALSPLIIKMMYGGDFAMSAAILKILILTYPLHALIGALIYSLFAHNKQLILSLFVGFTLILNVALDIVFIQAFGYVSVAIATLSSLFILLVLLSKFAIKNGYLNLSDLAFSRQDVIKFKEIVFHKIPDPAPSLD